MSGSTGTSGAHPSSSAPSRSTSRRRPTEQSSFARLLFENFGLKLLSLVVALGFYASMHTTSNAQRTLQVPLVADMPPPGSRRSLVSEIPQTISVTLEGPRTQLDALEARLDPIALNLRGARDETVAFTQAMLGGLPRAAKVSRIIPESLAIHWEDVIDRKVEVQVPIAGQLAKGIEVRGEVVVSPRQIEVTGPQSYARALQLARVEPFDLTGLGEGKHTRNLALAAPPTKLTFEQRHVEATIEIARKLATRELMAKVQVIGLARGRAEPAVVRVVVAGPPERVSTLKPESVLVRVDPKAAGADPLKPGSAVMPVIVDVLDATAQPDPPQVVVRW
jgi:hypothetical protein